MEYFAEHPAVVVIWIASAIVGFVVGSAKNRGALGFLLGAVFSIVGLVIIICLPTYVKPLPQFSVARGQKILGDFSITTINQMIGTGQLIATDYFLDVATTTWKPLRDLGGAVFPVKV